MINNGWNQYMPPPGMGYDQTNYNNPQYNYQCNPCNNNGFDPLAFGRQFQEAREEKLVKQTAVCCTLGVLAGVATGIYIGKHLKNGSSSITGDSKVDLYYESF